MARVLRTDAAEESRLDIWLHIASDSIQAADRLIRAIDDNCRLYATQPLMGVARPDLAPGIRCFPVGNYVAIYRPLPDGIEVMLVSHESAML
jgi:toxin ParE1/3/4